MSRADDVDDVDADQVTARFERYVDPSNEDRFIDFSRDVLDVNPSAVQCRILRAIAQHKYVQIQSANGVGKTFALALAKLGFLFGSADPAICYTTSGTYETLDDTLWKPMRSLFDESGLPGEDKQSPPRIEDLPGRPESYFKARSPEYAGSLEGRHGARMLVSVEEADKPDIDEEVIHSMETNVTDRYDRMVVVGNPPENETNVMHDLKQDDKYETIQFSAFESHNVANGLDEDDPGYIQGLLSPSKVRERWGDYNNEPWPGLDRARTAHERRDDLGQRWYRRVAGEVPPSGASEHRPIELHEIDRAWNGNLSLPTRQIEPRGLALDVARKGGDWNVLEGVFGQGPDAELAILDVWKGVDHVENERRVRDTIDDDWTAPFAIDANLEGSGLADHVAEWYPNTHRFDAGATAVADTEFRNCWTEGLQLLGAFLRDGVIADRKLREELRAAARSVTFSERYIKSRETSVVEATSKDAVKDLLGHSPDRLDGALMAVWAADADPDQDDEDEAFIVSY